MASPEKPIIIFVGNESELRRTGQWRGKVKIAEDFDELPEDILATFEGKRPCRLTRDN